MLDSKTGEMNKCSLLFVCNGIDETTLLERKITTDSPAATRKVLGLCKLLSNVGVKVTVASMGRGKTDRSISNYREKRVNVEGINFRYAPFSHIPIWSQFLSIVGLVKIILSFKGEKKVSVLFYNRFPAYLLSMYVANILGFKLFLDLEDGYYESISNEVTFEKKFAQIISHQFNKFCLDGTLLACRYLQNQIGTKNNLLYYGAVDDIQKNLKFKSKKIKILMSGTLSEETGLNMLLDMVNYLQNNNLKWANKLEFHITGNCSAEEDLIDMNKNGLEPILYYHGRLSRKEYKEVLQMCDVGLSLKPIGGIQANTTFPSKVLEYVESGLLLVSTDVSDVKQIFGKLAVIIASNDTAFLVAEFEKIVGNQRRYREIALKGQEMLSKTYSEDVVSKDLLNFLFEKKANKNG